MFPTNEDIPVLIDTTESKKFSGVTDDYAEFLQSSGITYQIVDYYLQVGEITKVQGWILHLSVIISQVQQLLELVIPLLSKENVAFKIPMNKGMAHDLLTGDLGIPQLGKVITIYPEDDAQALCIARKLIGETKHFEGPRVLTDVRLGSVVFTRYGGIVPIIRFGAEGNKEKYIYDIQGQLIRDPYSIPFLLPVGVQWPFGELVSYALPATKKTLRNVYKPISYLKTEPRGSVMLGLYLKNLFRVKKCVIKQGFRNMASDLAGRDIQDRLVWQYKLYQQLAGVIPMPAIFDQFQEEEGTYLVMEYIQGESLLNKLTKLNPQHTRWQDLSVSIQLKIVDYLITIVSIVSRLHERGYVHRDVVPVNFILDKKDRIFLIDNELTYSLSENYPAPPFDLGTAGFMSPEQQAIETPTIKEDIYGLGGTMLESLTGLTPVKFNTADTAFLFESLCFFIGNQPLASMITACLHHDPGRRPDTPLIYAVLTQYRKTLDANPPARKTHAEYPTTKLTQVQSLITASLKGLTKPPIAYINDIWYSLKPGLENVVGVKQKEYSVAPGLTKGLAGICYMLARAHRSGVQTESCKIGFHQSWEVLERHFLQEEGALSPGFYMGTAGIALALSQCIASGLLNDTPSIRERITYCLDIQPIAPDLANGLAGQGITLLQCQDHVIQDIFPRLLGNVADRIIGLQQKDGSWKVEQVSSFGYGVTGITWFLLAYLSVHRNTVIQSKAEKALQWILKKEKGQRGDVLTFIKAYQVLQEIRYKKRAEAGLSVLASHPVNVDFTQQSGLAGLGELYLEAAKVLNQEAWQQRANWIAHVFQHTFFQIEKGSGYWVMEENNGPTADFMHGNSGVIHFLLRYSHPSIGYRFLQ